MSRGRAPNTAHVVTRPVPDDAETGQTHEVAERSARAVLVDVIERDPGETELSVLAVREQADRDARSVMTHVDRLADHVGRITAGCTDAWLERLAADGSLSDLDRQRLAGGKRRASRLQSPPTPPTAASVA